MGRLAIGCTIALAATACSLQDLDGLGGGKNAHSGGTGGAGGSGGSTTEPCESGAVVGACGEDQKCTLMVPGQGIGAGFHCGPAGPAGAWAVCSSDADCEDGLWCESATRVCKPWCIDASACPEGAACTDARRADGTAVVGWKVCTAHCRPDNPSARCGIDTNCVVIQVDDGTGPRSEGDCAASEGKTAGCLCSTSPDCAAGLRCDPTDLRCHAWCEVGGTCAGGGSCGSTVTTYDGEGFGQCAATTCFNN